MLRGVAVLIVSLTQLTMHGGLSGAARAAAVSAVSDVRHHNYEEMLRAIDTVHRKCPDITYVYNLTGNPDHTVDGRKLTVIAFSDQPKKHIIGKYLLRLP